MKKCILATSLDGGLCQLSFEVGKTRKKFNSTTEVLLEVGFGLAFFCQAGSSSYTSELVVLGSRDIEVRGFEDCGLERGG